MLSGEFLPSGVKLKWTSTEASEVDTLTDTGSTKEVSIANAVMLPHAPPLLLTTLDQNQSQLKIFPVYHINKCIKVSTLRARPYTTFWQSVCKNFSIIYRFLPEIQQRRKDELTLNAVEVNFKSWAQLLIRNSFKLLGKSVDCTLERRMPLDLCFYCTGVYWFAAAVHPDTWISW